MEGAYKKKKGSLLTQSEHTITFLPAPRKTPTILSKRDIGHSNYSLEDQPCSSKQADQRLLASQRDMHETSKLAKLAIGQPTMTVTGSYKATLKQLLRQLQ